MKALNTMVTMRLHYFTALVLVTSGHAQLIQQVWPSTAFAPQAAAATSHVSAINFSSATSTFPPLCSVRFSGTLVDAASELVSFSLLSDGGVRLWLDDWLVIDAGGNRTAASPQRVDGFLSVPFTSGEPRALRLEYSRWGSDSTAPATLQLSWSGNVTSLDIIPPTAFAPNVSHFLVQRNALRDRLEVPRVPWQTYVMASLGAHALMPAGLALSATLAVGSGAFSNATLGHILPFRNGNPALVRPGLRSLNGSDYTLLTISQWESAPNVSVVLETTVIGGDLVFVARCSGSGCDTLLLTVQPFMMAERAGDLSTGADGRTLLASLPGFSSVTATALDDAVTVPWDCGDASPCFALSLSGGATGYWTGMGAPPTIATAQTAIVAAAAAALAAEAPYGPLAPLWEGTVSVLAWSTVYTPYEGVVTPVSHIMGNIWGIGYILFEWDTYFLALMASMDAGIARDLGLANLIQVTLGRTLMGFVPNGGAGPRRTYDRSENQVGARVLKEVVEKTGETWLLEGLLPIMLSWNDWVWTRRRGEGALAGEDGFADLMCLGSDPSSPRSDVQGTLQAARYEGMDNSVIYDAPPAVYDHVTRHMNVYDVGATALFASDTEATIALCVMASTSLCPPTTPSLAERLSRVQAAMNAHMWAPDTGMYANLLFNGTRIDHYAPTSFFPLLSGAATDAQAGAMAVELASPLGFCYNVSHTPAPDTDMLIQFSARSSRSAACVSSDCARAAVEGGSRFDRIEAAVLLPEGGPASDLVALNLFVNDATGATALVDGATPPDANFSRLVRQEGWCWTAPPTTGWPVTNLSLWFSVPAQEYVTCGTAACVNASVVRGFGLVRAMCFAYDATGPEALPCRVGGPSVRRDDASFLDQAYWRGRAWAPHHMLLYWALARYDHIPAARAVRKDLVSMGSALHHYNWDVFGVVCENVNGVIGTCEDSGNADPFYTWGALFGFTSFVEAGVY